MGGRGSKGAVAAEQKVNEVYREWQQKEREAHEQYLKRLLDQQKANEDAKLRDIQQFQQQIREARDRSDRRERDLNEERKQLEKEYNQKMASREESSKEERQQITADFNQIIKEKEEEMRRQKQEDDKEVKELREKQEKKEIEYTDEIRRINEARIEEERRNKDQMLEFVDRANEVIRKTNELMLTSQKEATDYMIQQQNAHLLTMTETYKILGSIPLSIQADKEAVHLEEQKAVIRCEITAIKKTYSSLENSFLDDDVREVIEQRKNIAKSLAEQSAKMNGLCTEMTNVLQISTNIPFELREKASSSVVSVKTKASELERKVLNLRHELKSTPHSISFHDLSEIRSALNSLNSAADEMPAIHIESTSMKIIGHIDALADYDSHNLRALERHRPRAIENPVELEETHELPAIVAPAEITA